MSFWNEPLLQAAVGLFFIGWFSYSALFLAVVVKDADVETNRERLDVAFGCFGVALLLGPMLLVWDIKKVIER